MRPKVKYNSSGCLRGNKWIERIERKSIFSLFFHLLGLRLIESRSFSSCFHWPRGLCLYRVLMRFTMGSQVQYCCLATMQRTMLSAHPSASFPLKLLAASSAFHLNRARHVHVWEHFNVRRLSHDLFI